MRTKPVKGVGKILVVDDEPAICDLVVRMIAGAGYRGCCARETKDALAFFRRAPDSLGAVLLDQSMEGSEAFYATLRAECPELLIIVTSGYSSSDATARFPGLDPEAFIQKPFFRQALIEILGRRLGPTGETGAALAHD